jgi:hypothetical protein
MKYLTNFSLIRVWLYTVSGTISAILGWSLGQFLLNDLRWLESFPEVVLFPSVAIALAICIVATDIFLCNPTRPKRNLRMGWLPMTIAAGLGLLIGLASGGITQIPLNPQMRQNVLTALEANHVRAIGWLLIGLAVGLAEGLTWRWRSVEAGDTKRFWQRLQTSAIASVVGALLAALIFEWVRHQFGQIPAALKPWEDLMGFSLLGGLLGFVLSFATSPSYMAALRAGAGFEYIATTGISPGDGQAATALVNAPRIQQNRQPRLKFVSDDDGDRIEEGLSIQLPARGKVFIGSAPVAHIWIPGLPLNAGHFELSPSETKFCPNPKFFYTVEYKGDRLREDRPITLKHNDLIIFHAEQGEYYGKKLFRFVYYNRFLDPQA